jgi:arsenical pump membrane protein
MRPFRRPRHSGKLVRVGSSEAVTSHADRVTRRNGAGVASSRWLGWGLAVLGIVGLAVAAAWYPSQARLAAAQDWSPFVLVAGLLLIGVVADDDGLFAAAGHQLARLARNGPMLFLGAALIVGVVTAVLNLDTSVAFVTPVLVYTARSKGEGEAPLLYGALLLANAGSLFLPGSNLTNLIVLGHLHLSGGQFLAHMWAPALAALLVTAAVVATFEHRSLRANGTEATPADRPVLGLGLAAVASATVLVVVLASPAIPVAAVGVAAIGIRIAKGKDTVGHVAGVLSLPVLVGLFGVAVALGTLGRVWSGPATLLSHLDSWGTAGLAALTSVLLNNLPAASLLAARTPSHPFAMLIGLNLGPNLFVTGSLAWLLWLQAARTAGAQPSIAKASRLGLVAVPLSMAAALGLLALTGSG